MNNTFTEKWAINTDKRCSSIQSLPKVQQFKEYNFPKRTDNDIKTYQNFFLKSDNIALTNNFPSKYKEGKGNNTTNDFKVNDNPEFNKTMSHLAPNYNERCMLAKYFIFNNNLSTLKKIFICLL